MTRSPVTAVLAFACFILCLATMMLWTECTFWKEQSHWWQGRAEWWMDQSDWWSDQSDYWFDRYMRVR